MPRTPGLDDDSADEAPKAPEIPQHIEETPAPQEGMSHLAEVVGRIKAGFQGYESEASNSQIDTQIKRDNAAGKKRSWF